MATSARPYSYFPGTTYVHDVPTAAMHCGGSASWYTVSFIVLDGGGLEILERSYRVIHALLLAPASASEPGPPVGARALSCPSQPAVPL